MTLDPDLLASYVQAVVMHGLHPDDSTIDCGGVPCSGCPLSTNLGISCKLNAVAESYDLNYDELERTIIQPVIRQTHPELFV